MLQAILSFLFLGLGIGAGAIITLYLMFKVLSLCRK